MPPKPSKRAKRKAEVKKEMTKEVEINEEEDLEEDLAIVFDSNQTSDRPGTIEEGENKMKIIEKDREHDAKTRASDLLLAMQSQLTSPKIEIEKAPLKRPNEVQNGAISVPEKKLKEDENMEEIEPDLDEGAKLAADDMKSLEELPRIRIHKLETEEKCVHEVAIPPDTEYTPLKVSDQEPARDFEFVLDPFQKEGILCLDNYQSVLVSAHTSAGKTVIALYAIAMSLRDKQRVIYTSPIKALSNQKYRELQDEIQDVGLMTGDVTLNPNASCLVMTTEILRSMLYRGSEIMREVGWVVFDEIHYMRDKERGVVWEEAIILLPDNVHYVFLSATIPNARQFAEWVTFLHSQPCHVVYTEHRPVPLQHYIFPAGGKGLYEVVSVEGKFNDPKFDQAMSCLQDVGEAGGGFAKKGRKGGTKGESEVVKILRTMSDNGLMPVICFSFSRKECEAYATNLKEMDFNNEEDKRNVNEIFDNAVEILSEEDRKLPQLENIFPLLKRGIGIHHSGLLPILKETVEILFAEGLLKCLFATETFSMGLNMPARTVIFTSARKFDGTDYRWITSGEYIQMSGRAGRRGKDDKGLVVLMVDQQMGADTAKNIVKGKADPLNSQFRLTYNMVLNLLRVEGINPEFMLERSFFQFQNYAALPGLYSKVKKLQLQLKTIEVPRELEISGYYQIESEIDRLGKDMLKVIMKPIHCIPYLSPGRIVHVTAANQDFGFGVVISYNKQMKKDLVDPTKNQSVYMVGIALNISNTSIKSAKIIDHVGAVRPNDDLNELGKIEVLPCELPLIDQITAIKIRTPENIKSPDVRQTLGRTILEVKKRFPDGLPVLDPIEDMNIMEKPFKEIVKQLRNLQSRKHEHPLKNDGEFKKIYDDYKHKLEVEENLKSAKVELKKAKSLLQMDELKCRKRVLRRLGYADETDVITSKGRVACEISTADELILTELIFGGVFEELSVQQCAALLSCFVFQENAESTQLAEELTGCLRKIQQYARHIAKVTAESKLPIDEDKYVEGFRPHLMDVVHKWCSGFSFGDIIKSTSVFEGSIIRTLRRLEELLRETVLASRSIGNEPLEKKFLEAIERIKRDIVFAASLYL